MAAFAPLFVAQQSSDGKTITFTDQSPWGAGNNDENYLKANFVRTFTLVDAFGEDVAVLTLPTNVDSIAYSITKDVWLQTTYKAVGVQTYQLVQKQMFDRFTVNAYRAKINEENCCGKHDQNLCMANVFIKGADYAEPVGDGVSTQKFIDAAFSYLSA